MSVSGCITRNSRSRSQAIASQDWLNSVPTETVPVIEVFSGPTYQTIDGFGFALTGGSAMLIAGLAAGTRAALLRELFGAGGDAVGISCLRLTIGASDLSSRAFSYSDLRPGESEPDSKRFDLFAGDVEVVPVLREILAVNPDLLLIASPWSAPVWMKTNGGLVAGELRRQHFQTYARYLTTYLQAMRAHGITIQAITVQNEPHNPKNEPSMVMSATAQARFIRDHLGPAIKAAALPTEIFCWDHNCNEPEFPLAVLGDPLGAEAYVSGVAWHLYQGDPEAIGKVHEAYPNKKMYLTEQWVSADGLFEGDLRWHIRNVFIGAIRNGCRAVLEWNLAADPHGGPHTPGGAPNCLGAITIGETITRNVGHAMMAHTARFVPPGSVRIASTEHTQLPNVAFRTPNGRIALLLLNDTDATLRFALAYQGGRVETELSAGAVATYVWDASPVIA